MKETERRKGEKEAGLLLEGVTETGMKVSR